MADRLVTTLQTICAECGAVYERTPERPAGRCDECRPQEDNTARDNREYLNTRKGSARSRGYDARWDRLSKRARALQPFCSDCGRTDDLTTDHTPEAWKRHEQGKTIRLKDVDVVCRECNAERGAARGADAAGYWERRAAVGEWLPFPPED